VPRNWQVRHSRAAKADLYEIWSYIAAHDELAAFRWLEKFDAAIADQGIGGCRGRADKRPICKEAELWRSRRSTAIAG
jgi:plasmid stabilization system protein ParE